MLAWFVSLRAAIADLRTAWQTKDGGWRAIWRNVTQLLTERRLIVETAAVLPAGPRTVLRTQVRLTGDVQTDILRGWWQGTECRSREAVIETHFRDLSAALRAWPAMTGLLRLVVVLLVLPGGGTGLTSAFRTAVRGEWASLPAALVSDRIVVFGAALAAGGILLRWLVRLFLRRRFARGLMGPR